MKSKLDRIISIATLLAALVAIVLVLKKPAPVAQPQGPAAVAVPSQPAGQKIDQAAAAAQQAPPASSGNYSMTPSQSQQTVASNPQPKSESHLAADGIGALLAQAAGAAGAGELSPDSDLGGGERGERRLGNHLGTYGIERWVCDVRAHGIQSGGRERAGFAGESGIAEKAGRAARPFETSRVGNVSRGLQDSRPRPSRTNGLILLLCAAVS
jgi:hypothetical protein